MIHRAPSYSLYVFTTVINKCYRPLCICFLPCKECQQHSAVSKLMIIVAGKVFNTGKSLGRRIHFSIHTLLGGCSGDNGVVSGMFSILKMWRHSLCFCSKRKNPSTFVSVSESSSSLHASYSSSVYLSFITTYVMDLVSLLFPF